MAKLADNAATENAKKVVEADKKISDKSRSEYSRLTKGKPTPTQEELDIVAAGGHVLEHEADGSDEEAPRHETRHMEAENKSQSKPAPYQTRTPRSHE